MFYLEVFQGEKSPAILHFERAPVAIGRDASMDVVLPDATISRQSALIIERDGSYFLQDLGGRNTIRVNDRRVVSHRLGHGDVLSFGSYQLVFRCREDTSSNTPSSTDTIADPRQSLQHWRSAAERPTPADAGSLSLRAGVAPEKILDILHGYTELIRQLPDRDRLFDAALAPIYDILDVKRSFIGIFGEDGILEIVAERNDASVSSDGFSRTIVERVQREGVGILFGEDAEPPNRSDSRSQVRLKIKSAMCVPIVQEDRVRGVLYLDNRGRVRSFTRNDLHFANILAHLVSLALDKEELYRRVYEENLTLKSQLRRRHRIVGVSGAVRELRRKIRRVGAFDSTVLLLGESGTGKELVARAIHERSPRKDRPFVAVNCAAIPETLLENELFGYARHSGISGADPGGRAGKFELAHTGTLFLDEIGDMSLATQAKILRVLEERVVDRLGSQDVVPVDIRIITATNKNLEEEVASGSFREDLFYRLKVLKVDLPPLRHRTEDILPIATYFLEELAGGDRGRSVRISTRAREVLLAYRWPGNVRELRNVIEEALLMGNGRVIYPEDLPAELTRKENQRVFGSLAEVEAVHLHRVLDGVNWNKRRASEILGINRSTLYDKIRLYGLEPGGETEQEGAVRASASNGRSRRGKSL